MGKNKTMGFAFMSIYLSLIVIALSKYKNID
jgi:hypothetical protein